MLTKIDINNPDYTRYEIKKGQNNFRPYDKLWPVFRPKGFEVVFWMDESCWYNWLPDKDQNDWNKGKGISNRLSANNHQSAIIVWRPAKEQFVFEFTAYTNDKKGDFVWNEDVVRVEANQLVQARCDFKNGKANYKIRCGFTERETTHDFKRPFIGAEIGTSIGGANNSPGPYGGEASQDMFMHVQFERL